MEAKIRRQLAMVDARRALVLDAARVTFARLGLERTSMREIAKEAGYTVGALYAYFASKQEILSALLEEMAVRLQTVVMAAKAPKGHPDQLVLAQARAWLAFFISQPNDTALMLYLLAVAGTHRAQGDSGQRVHGHLRKTLDPLAEALTVLGATPAQRAEELESLLAHCVGLLIANDISRLQAAQQSPENLLGRYVHVLIHRYHPDASTKDKDATGSAPAPQVDLFR